MMKPLPEKLGLKTGHRLIVVHAPPDLDCNVLGAGCELRTQLRGDFDQILAFVTTQQELGRGFDSWKIHLKPEGRLWICWPKASGPASELNIKSVIRIGYEHGMVESNAIRIAEGWSGLKFTHPKAGKEYRNSYGTLNTEAVIHYR